MSAASSSSDVLVPVFKWAQDKDNLYIKVDIIDVDSQQMSVQIERESMKFAAVSHGKSYGFEINFRFPVNPKTANYSVKRLPEFLLEKETSDAWWPHLLKVDDKKKFKGQCQTDWDKFIDEDDAEEEDAKMDTGGIDWSQMAGMGGGMGGMGGGMPGMGGMGGMAGMPGMEGLSGMDFSNFGGIGDDTDSDDDDEEDDNIPELDDDPIEDDAKANAAVPSGDGDADVAAETTTDEMSTVD